MTKTQARDARKNAKSPLIRIPAEMKARIESLRDQLVESYEAGRVDLPEHVNCENIPLWYVLERALDELESHRERSKKSRRNSAKPKAE